MEHRREKSSIAPYLDICSGAQIVSGCAVGTELGAAGRKKSATDTPSPMHFQLQKPMAVVLGTYRIARLVQWEVLLPLRCKERGNHSATGAATW